MVLVTIIYLLSTVLKIFWGIKDNNLSMLSDGLDSVKNVVTLSTSYIFFRVSQQRADITHHFGHGKYDIFGAVIIGAFQIFFAGITITASILKFGESPLETSLLHSVISFVIMVVVVLSVFYFARKYKSEALKAEIWHELSDLVQSLLVILSTFLSIRYFPYINSFFAMSVSVILLIGGIRAILLIEKFLLDKAPPAVVTSVISKVNMEKVSIKDVKSLVSGKNKVRIELTIGIDGEMQLGQAHKLGHEIESEIVERLKNIGWIVENFVIHIEPK